MSRMKTIAMALLALLASALPSAASAADPVTGRWLTQDRDAIITVARCGATYCGRISRFLVPPPQGLDQRDINNPDAKLRKRKLLGLPVLSRFTKDGALWRGRIYDPKTGKSYRSILRRKNATTLEVKGCIGPFCQTQIWKRAS